MSSTSVGIGLWLNHSFVEGGLVTSTGELFAYERIPTISDGILGTFFQLCQHLLSVAPKLKMDVQGIGVALDARLDLHEGVILSANPFFKSLIGFPLVDALQKEFSLTTHLASQAQCIALAECLFGAGQHAQEAIYVHVDTDISSAIWRNGALWYGAHSQATDLGQVIAEWLGEKPITLTQKASAHGIIAEYGMRSRKFVKPTIQEIIQYSHHDDQLAMRVLRDGARIFSTVVASYFTILDPELVIVGGELALSSPLWWERFQSIYQQYAVPAELRKASLLDNSPIIGAGLLAKSK